MGMELLVRNTSEVLCVAGLPTEPAEQALRAMLQAVVGVSEGRIAYLGPESGLPAGAVGPQTRVLDALGGFVGPGFVDPHTHVVFAGERSHEFDLRCQGASYLQIAQRGGGIMSTVRATRAASEADLVSLALPRLSRLLAQGVTHAEVKSGYGLSLADELKMLRVIQTLGSAQPIELSATLLCAHALPEEWKHNRQGYVDLCINDILPAVASQKLARFCDAFAEEGAFTLPEAKAILLAAAKLGMIPRLHADQLTSSGGAVLAAEVGAASADHLENISDAGIRALARAGVSAVLVPTSTLFLRQTRHAPGRRLREEGINVALGTNVNPGSAMTENVSLALGLACLQNGLSAAEAYWGMTRGAALALKRPDLGKLEVGGAADLVIFSCRSHRHLPYHLAMNHTRRVVKAGKVVFESADADAPLCE